MRKLIAVAIAALALQGCAEVAQDVLGAQTIRCDAGELHSCRGRAATELMLGMRTNQEAADEARMACLASVRRGKVNDAALCETLHRLVLEQVPGAPWKEPNAL